MTKNLGSFNFSANLAVKVAEALDPRMIASSKADLIKKENWPSEGDTIYVYKGLIVDCGDDGVYRLIDESKVLATDFSGWERIDSQSKQDKFEDGSDEKPHLIWSSDNWKPGKILIKDIILTQSDDGLKTNLELWYNSLGEAYNNQYDKDANGIKFKKNHIYLLGKDEDAIPYIISEFDATSFIKDSFLSDVQYLVITGEEAEGEPGYGANVEPGKYIAFYFATIEKDNQSNIDDVYSQQVIYLNVKDFYIPVSVTDDVASYSVVDKNTGTDGSDIYTVKNILGTISRDNSANTITVSKAGLATVGDIKTVFETINSNLNAVKADSANKDEIAVVTGITQVDGKITAVDSGLSATKTYVDNKFGEIKHNIVSAPKTEDKENYATVTPTTNADGSTNYEVVVSGIDNAIATATVTGIVVNQGTNGAYNFVEINKGLMTADAIASLMNEAWSWGTI